MKSDFSDYFKEHNYKWQDKLIITPRIIQCRLETYMDKEMLDAQASGGEGEDREGQGRGRASLIMERPLIMLTMSSYEMSSSRKLEDMFRKRWGNRMVQISKLLNKAVYYLLIYSAYMLNIYYGKLDWKKMNVVLKLEKKHQ